MQSARANLLLLAACWACALSSSTLLTAVGPLAATATGSSIGAAPLTISTFLAGAALISIPSAALFRHCGRLNGFLIGCGLCVCSGAAGAIGLICNIPSLIFISSFLAGLAQGLSHFYRFAALEVCSPSQRPYAVTLVLSGGVIAAVAGPNLALATKELGRVFGDSRRYEFLGAFAGISTIGVLNALFSVCVTFPASAGKTSAPVSQSLPRLMCADPRCIAAVAIAALAHTSMVSLMSPLVVVMHDGCEADAYPIGSCWSDTYSSLTLQLHFLAMFGPGFVTGRVISTLGPQRTSCCGAFLLLIAAGTLAAGGALENFIAGMTLCGLGWNLCFTAGTLLLASSEMLRECRLSLANGANDFIIFFFAGIGSTGSGYINGIYGWRCVAGIIVLALILALALLMLMKNSDRL
ncbi:hypothetical protein EMIHUDRAFT_229213 [Emiliania huxleyi CCMP1516]|uniref:Major facilitator superfamily (MFS) profile domain-containing protein n=2 Tax=Emiliania huxleyi TaxID=2903 RepID=A0A0D3KDA2_EMIH1|nr:hypothetical protein EMIHUDRAFT_229213 [Emiliania huxleyi CCMP1516]EOD33737.1 hypothetical protein EMIHUDRAFT_229213 [Emiliania huxleyi CCMP1516]|eukprot:XP_005786166.1 hypothetical protein EMIHUDRAFT_229213 [Emiliania huxleyi CCMP1516]